MCSRQRRRHELTARMPRKEDARFVRGRGRFIDDIALPGHAARRGAAQPARPRRGSSSVDTFAAESHPLVRAVLTGAQLAERGLAWMPTLSHDVQAVLATDKVRYQGQEVAFVVAETRYAARDALALIDVEYEPLPAVIDARQALDADAPRGPRREASPTTTSSTGRPATPGRPTPRSPPPSTWSPQTWSTPGCTRRRWRPAAWWPTSTRSPTSSPSTRRPGPARAPDACCRGSRAARSTGSASMSPDIGGGFGNKVGLYPGYVCAVVGVVVTGAGQVDGGPVGEPDGHGLRPRLPHARRDRGHPRRQDPGVAGARCSPTTARSTPRRSPRGSPPGSSTCSPAPTTFRRALPGHRRLHEQGARRRGLRVLVPGDRGVLPRRAHGRRARLRPRAWTRPSCGCATCCAPSSSPTRAPPAGSTTRATTRGPCAGPGDGRLRGAARRSRRRSRAARASCIGIGHQLLHRGGGRRAARAHGHPRAGHGRRRASCGCTRPARRCSRCRAVAGAGPRDDVRPDRRAGAGHRAGRDRGRAGRHRPDTPFGLGTYGSRSTPVSGRGRGRGRPARCGTGRGWSRRRCWRCSPDDLEWETGRFQVRGVTRRGRDHPGDRHGRALRPGAARGRRGPPGRDRRLQPAQPDLPVRRVRLRRRRRPGHRPGRRCAGSSRWTTAACGSTR